MKITELFDPVKESFVHFLDLYADLLLIFFVNEWSK